VAYTDRLVGQVMAKLRAEGLWDKALVVMGADHGQGWTPGEPSRALRPGEPATSFAALTPDFLWRAGDGHRQLQLCVVAPSSGQPHLQPVAIW
jgi:arylsulfatase A-like enzyme